jgi:Domain of unknown function (DUF4258)
MAFAMNDEHLRRRIAQVAVDSSRVFLTGHARKQMLKRRVNRRQVDDVLKKGYVVEPAHRNIHGNWQCTLEYRTSGEAIRLAAALETGSSGESVVVITVMN